MFITDKIMYGLDDITIIPSTKTKILHRGDINIKNEDGKYPIFVSPMSSIINEHNYKTFEDAGLNVIIPRTVDINIRLKLIYTTFVAVGLAEFEELFCNDKTRLRDNDKKYYVCIDIANGHMEYMHNLVFEAKLKYRRNLIVMIGNVANIEVYESLAKIGVDYVRVGIGGGSVCTTAVVSGCYATLPYLLNGLIKMKQNVLTIYREINNTEREVGDLQEIDDIIVEIRRLRGNGSKDKIKNNCEQIYTVPKIIVDGGIDSFAKINKLLAIGADYIMLGGMMAKTKEACAETVEKDGKLYHVYYGMSTHKAQLQYGKTKENLRIEEGIEKLVPIEYTLNEFIEKFSFYLREAMSLTDCSTLQNFNQKNVNIMLISNNGFSEFNSNK